MKIIPYQYAPYMNINTNNIKNKKNFSFLVTTTNQNNKLSKITVNTKSEINPTVGSFQSPVSFISGEDSFNLFKEIKPEIIKDFYGSGNEFEKEPSMTDLLPPKPIPNNTNSILNPKLSKLDNLSFVSDEILKINSFKVNDSRQSSLDIVNSDYQPNEFEMYKRMTIMDSENLKEEEEKEKEKSNNENNEENKESRKEQENDKVKEKQGIFKPLVDLHFPNIPVKSPIEGFKTDITLSPMSATTPHPIATEASYNDLQSNMNGNIFQNHRFNAYLESINTINHNNITNPMNQQLHTNYKYSINENKTQLKHPSDLNRYTFPKIIEAYDAENKKIQDMTPMTEEELQKWLSTATPEDIYANMNKVIGIPKKMNTINSKTMEVFTNSPNYPTLGMDQYIYKEPKALAPLSAKYKNYNVSIYIKNSDFHCTTDNAKFLSKLSIFPFPLHIVIGVSSCENILNVHIVVQNSSKDYCIKTLSFKTASETIALTYTDILYENVYYDEQNILRTSFVQIYIDKDNEDLRRFVNRWFRVPFELAGCNYEIITDVNEVSISAQVFIFMTQKKDLYKNLESLNKWEDSMAIVHQTIYGHPLQVVMATLKERLYERWMLDYNDWKRYKSDE